MIAGNTFGFPCVHGQSIMAAGYSFVSASVKSVEQGLPLNGYFAVDMIFGKQKESVVGRGAVPNRYKIYSKELMDALTAYTAQGGNVMATGANVASDVWDGISSGEVEQKFASEVLGYKWRVARASTDGRVYTVATPYKQLTYGTEYVYSHTLNDRLYCVESPDGVIPSGKGGHTVFRYGENNIPAGVAADMGNYRTVVAGFPFEVVESEEARNTMMKQVLEFFSKK